MAAQRAIAAEAMEWTTTDFSVVVSSSPNAKRYSQRQASSRNSAECAVCRQKRALNEGRKGNWLQRRGTKLCIHRRIDNATRNQWTISQPKEHACLSCTNAQLPCLVFDEEEDVWWLLPLAPEVRASSNATNIGHYIAGEKHASSRHPGLWESRRKF